MTPVASAAPVPETPRRTLPAAWLRIPDRLNVALVLLVAATLIGLLVAGAHTHSPWLRAALIAAFALLFLTNFALLHEAAHFKLHSRPRWNYALGVLAGLLFPLPFSLFSATHWNHHLRNRTDFEHFDIIYPGESALKRRALWYLALGGLWYWLIPPACLVLSLGPGFLRRWLAARHARQGGIGYDDYQRLGINRIRVEMALAGALFLGLGALVGWRVLLLFYLVGPILWSSTQYLEHAFAPRDVIHGAFDLRAHPLLSVVNLNRELDLAHHRHTRVPWLHLRNLAERSQPQPTFFRHYLRVWRGPVRGEGPGPAPLQEILPEEPV